MNLFPLKHNFLSLLSESELSLKKKKKTIETKIIYMEINFVLVT